MLGSHVVTVCLGERREWGIENREPSDWAASGSDRMGEGSIRYSGTRERRPDIWMSEVWVWHVLNSASMSVGDCAVFKYGGGSLGEEASDGMALTLGNSLVKRNTAA